MLLEEPRCRSCRLLTVHGQQGFNVTDVLQRSGIRLSADDVLVIIEHDDPVISWLELDETPLLAA